jgi:transposase
MMAAALRSQLTREQRRNVVLDYYLKGWSLSQISRELKVARSTISKDIAAIREEWRCSRADSFHSEQLHELARIDAIEREVWAQWESSKAEEVTTRAETEVLITEENGRQVRKPGAERVIRVTKIRNADPRYMDTIRWCVEMRCKLLGLLAPCKMAAPPLEGSTPPKVHIDLSTLTDEQLEALDALRDRLLGLPPSSSNPSLN